MSESKAKCVWGRKEAEGISYNTVSLNEVMSEQLASDLQESEEKRLLQEIQEAELKAIGVQIDEPFTFHSEPDTGNDHLLAQLLQMEFDKEHDVGLLKKQNQINGKSKVSLSFDRYRRLPYDVDSSDDDDEMLDDSKRDWDSFEKAEKSSAGVTIGKHGFAKHDGLITTKHDANVCGRRNACKAMDFDISTGDGGGFDMKLNNNVYNALKVHSMSEGKRAARLHEKKEKSSAEGVMDETTRLILYKLVNRGLLEEVNGIVSTGKESNVYHGIGGDPEKQITTGEVAIKVYKTTLNEFKNRDPYIKDDFRFKDRFSKQNPRKIIHLWAEKECTNLLRISRAGILCPKVVILKKHILVMTLIGKGKPAPTLKEANLSESQLEEAYKQTVEIMTKLFMKCDLIHADLSEYNLLWFENRVWVIDVSQSVFTDHPNALKFLLRDCYNISNKGAANVMSCADLFSAISSKKLPDEKLDGIDLLLNIENFERNNEILTHGIETRGDAFEEMFAISSRERKSGDKLVNGS
ncbi:serine/threonine-protein kinase RIO3-like protein [Dinothrombium tinctorium]|uniref:Serine/threonine-protein kinase RIO3 n=1 Tax=Dinothrombium tinctorium TaxID=1965070 RepID=A0A443QHN7_9ACAR|nr:serine/threonine-protein kinase RIO3-like protein [Dinothrombium tinctorium]